MPRGCRITGWTGIGSAGTIVRQGRAWLLGDRFPVPSLTAGFFCRSAGGATDQVETDRSRTMSADTRAANDGSYGTIENSTALASQVKNAVLPGLQGQVQPPHAFGEMNIFQGHPAQDVGRLPDAGA